jgi:hypothetical protein
MPAGFVEGKGSFANRLWNADLSRSPWQVIAESHGGVKRGQTPAPVFQEPANVKAAGASFNRVILVTEVL